MTPKTAFLLIGLAFFGKPIEAKDYLDEYFDKVGGSFHEKLDEIGINSLKINDSVYDVNRTMMGLTVFGTMEYSDFFIVSYSDLRVDTDWHRGTPEDDGVHLKYQFVLMNLTIFSNVKADLYPLGTVDGTAGLWFNETTFTVQLDKNYTLGTTLISTRPYMTMGPSTDFRPINDVMDAAGRIARLELGYRMLWDHVQWWCETKFTPMITDIMDKLEFPMFPPSNLDTAQSLFD